MVFSIPTTLLIEEDMVAKMSKEIFLEIEEEDGDNSKPIFDFSSPEDVLFEVVGPHDESGSRTDWRNFSIETCTIINFKEGVTGAASYDAEYGGFLDYTIQSMIDPPGEGWFVMVGITGEYHKGDGWVTDDDMTFDFKTVRPATEEEKKLV